MSRIPEIRRLLTEQVIEELLVKFILNIGENQQQQNRIAHHMRLAYFHFFLISKLNQQKDSRYHDEEEVFFMNKLNQYLPDFLRFQAQSIPHMKQQCAKIPVFGAIISRNNSEEYLLVQDRRTHKYGYAKGKISQGQTPYECIMRQVKQQIGLTVRKFGSSFPVQVKGKEYIFMEAEVDLNHRAHKDIIYEGDNHHREIKKSVWWSKDKIRHILKQGNRGIDKLNYPTFQTFRKIV